MTKTKKKKKCFEHLDFGHLNLFSPPAGGLEFRILVLFVIWLLEFGAYST